MTNTQITHTLQVLSGERQRNTRGVQETDKANIITVGATGDKKSS